MCQRAARYLRCTQDTFADTIPSLYGNQDASTFMLPLVHAAASDQRGNLDLNNSNNLPGIFCQLADHTCLVSVVSTCLPTLSSAVRPSGHLSWFTLCHPLPQPYLSTTDAHPCSDPSSMQPVSNTAWSAGQGAKVLAATCSSAAHIVYQKASPHPCARISHGVNESWPCTSSHERIRYVVKLTAALSSKMDRLNHEYSQQGMLTERRR